MGYRNERRLAVLGPPDVNAGLCLQEALERHQRLFVWDETGDGGIYTLVEKELTLRAQTLGDVKSIMT